MNKIKLAGLGLSPPSEAVVSKVVDLDRQHFSEPWNLSQWSELAQDWSQHVLVWEEAFGAFLLAQSTHLLEPLHLLKVLVLPSRRRQGLGRLLLQTLAQSGTKLGLSPKLQFYLEVAEGNQVALTFYESLGFEQCHYQSNYYSSGQGAYKMIAKGQNIC